ncbi:MAG: hypothetical protein M3114_04210, partial [Thermoproteota archaeon]|nr:hypothetical protein [Thermoproteota archaeon]
MIKTSSTLQHSTLSAVLGLFLFVSFITYYNHSITNDYNTLLNYSYFLHPFSMIDADASTIETDNDDSSAQD